MIQYRNTNKGYMKRKQYVPDEKIQKQIAVANTWSVVIFDYHSIYPKTKLTCLFLTCL